MRTHTGTYTHFFFFAHRGYKLIYRFDFISKPQLLKQCWRSKTVVLTLWDYASLYLMFRTQTGSWHVHDVIHSLLSLLAPGKPTYFAAVAVAWPAIAIFMFSLQLENSMVPPGPVNSFHLNSVQNKPLVTFCWSQISLLYLWQLSIIFNMLSQHDLVYTLCKKKKKSFTLTHHIHSSPNAVMGIDCSSFLLTLT